MQRTVARRPVRSRQAARRMLSSAVGEYSPSLSKGARVRPLGLAEADKAAALAVSGALLPGHLPRMSGRVRVPWDDGVVSFTIDDLLSEQECASLIGISESYGYEKALVNIGGGQQVDASENYRKSGRWMVDSEDAAAILWRRMGLIPAVSNNFAKLAMNARTGWRPVGLNPRRRFLRYSPGDYFAPHSDDYFECGETGRKSFMTLMLYLNTPASGGETNFLNPHRTRVRDSASLTELRTTDGRSCAPRSGDLCVSVRPTTGMALFFDHEMYHEGALLAEGIKYSIRTDVMFEVTEQA
jgi:hypothetical protein